MIEKYSSVDDDLSTKIKTEFIIRFYRLLKGAILYNPSNIIISQYTQECVKVINYIIESEGYLFLKIARDSLFLNNIKVRVRADSYPILKGLSREMRKRWIGEFRFNDRVKAEHLRDFIFLLARLEGKHESNYLYVKTQLEYRNVKYIDLGALELFKDEEIYFDSENKKRYSNHTYFNAIGLMKEIVESVKGQKVINIRKAKRLMQNAVNAIMEDESTLLGLASIKNYDESTFNHSVNVAIYAIALGQRIGIPKRHLSHLGVTGLFHDIGKIEIPIEIINKEGTLTSEEWEVVRSHPVIGSEIVMKMKEWGELITRMIDGTFEHHLKYDQSGYPKLTRKRKLTLFGRIVALADFFDACGRPRQYSRYPYISENILGFMLQRSGKDFDPALVKVFVNMMGIYPLGTLVLLNTNEMGIVIQTQVEVEQIDRPKVSLIYYSEEAYRKGEIVDLTEKDKDTGEFKRTIMNSLDPNEYNINVAEFLI